jgi:hypothetical protein
MGVDVVDHCRIPLHVMALLEEEHPRPKRIRKMDPHFSCSTDAARPIAQSCRYMYDPFACTTSVTLDIESD